MPCGMLQPPQQAQAWNSGEPATNMNAFNGQQWPIDPPPHFVLPKRPRVVPCHFPPQLHPRLFETQSFMDSPDWNVRSPSRILIALMLTSCRNFSNSRMTLPSAM